MPEGIRGLNNELSLCLKAALRKRRKTRLSSKNLKKEVDLVTDLPAVVPGYLLFAVARELGVSEEICLIIWDWQIR